MARRFFVLLQADDAGEGESSTQPGQVQSPQLRRLQSKLKKECGDASTVTCHGECASVTLTRPSSSEAALIAHTCGALCTLLNPAFVHFKDRLSVQRALSPAMRLFGVVIRVRC